MLESNGIAAIITRNWDYTPGNFENYPRGELGVRVNLAESKNVDLFVSVHINAGGGTGAEVLIVGRGEKAETAAYKVLPHLVEGGNWANRGVKT